VLTPHFLALLVEALQNKPVEERLSLVDEALAMASRTREKSYLAELHRIRGELLLVQKAGRARTRALARSCFSKSIKIARQQNALAWELRAVMSMARLYRSRNKRKEARSLLAKAYSRFTEGFGTVDLLDAKALLDELS
jgi:predicted ATPase